MRSRFDRRTRAKLLEAGYWQRHDGRAVELRRMADPHLVNALLSALADGEPRAITDRLATEVNRRGLRDYALTVAQARNH